MVFVFCPKYSDYMGKSWLHHLVVNACNCIKEEKNVYHFVSFILK